MRPGNGLSWIVPFVLACLPSCCVPQSGKQAFKEIIINKNDLSRFVNPECVDTLLTAAQDSNMTMHIIDDKLCLLFFKKENRPLKIEIWNLSQDSRFYSYQSENDHLIMPFATFSWNSILIHDVLKQKTVSIEIDRASSEPGYSPTVRQSNLSAINILPWGSRQVFLNDYSYVDGIPRVCFTDKKWNYKEKHKYSFNSSNVVHGELVCDQERTRIAYIPSNDSKIEIMGGKGEKEIIVDFFHATKQEVISVNRENGVFYVFRFPPILCFSKACAGHDSFLAGYIDDDGNHSVAILDWNGNLLGGFKVWGEIRDLSYSEDEKTIYVFERIGDHDYLIKYMSPIVYQ